LESPIPQPGCYQTAGLPSFRELRDVFAAKANAGELTPTDEADYREYVEGVDLFGILNAKVRRSMSRHAS
jgi:hypothetical protein